MKQNEEEILVKLMEIARLKKEIVQMIVPEKTYKHLEVIGNEFKALLTDLISDVACECDCKPSDSDHPLKAASKQQSKVKKVDID